MVVASAALDEADTRLLGPIRPGAGFATWKRGSTASPYSVGATAMGCGRRWNGDARRCSSAFRQGAWHIVTRRRALVLYLEREEVDGVAGGADKRDARAAPFVV